MSLLVSVLLGCLLSVCMAEDCKEGQLVRGCKPKHCGAYECPKYWTVARRNGYEIRCYAPTNWAMMRSSTLNQITFTSEMLHLNRYIGYGNSEKKSISMAVPVITENWKYGPSRKENSTLGLWLPKPCNTSLPSPTDSKVFLQRKEKFCVYVRSFGGYHIGNTVFIWNEFGYLEKSLKKDSRAYDKDVSFVAWYNNPLTPLFRHNEVWKWPIKEHQEQYLAMVEDPRIDASCQ